MSVTSTEDLDKLGFILYDRPAGRNIIGHAIDTIESLREEVRKLKEQNRILATNSLRDAIKSIGPSGTTRGQRH